MPTALAEWTTERPDVPGFYWWRKEPKADAEVVELYRTLMPNDAECWDWYLCGDDVGYNDAHTPIDALWWPVRLDPPPIG